VPNVRVAARRMNDESTGEASGVRGKTPRSWKRDAALVLPALSSRQDRTGQARKSSGGRRPSKASKESSLQEGSLEPQDAPTKKGKSLEKLLIGGGGKVKAVQTSTPERHDDTMAPVRQELR